MKKFLCAFLVLIMVFSVFTPMVSASGTNVDHILAEIEKTNQEIENLIVKAQVEANREIEKTKQENKLIEAAFGKIGFLRDLLVYLNEMQLNQKIDSIVKKLVADTDRLSFEMIRKAAKYGVNVICEYVEVEIGNRKVLIDPLRVVGF